MGCFGGFKSEVSKGEERTRHSADRERVVGRGRLMAWDRESTIRLVRKQSRLQSVHEHWHNMYASGLKGSARSIPTHARSGPL